MVAKKKKSTKQNQHTADDRSGDGPSKDLEQVLVGGPLLGSRQRNIASDFAAWDRFEPIITPEISRGDRSQEEAQRFVLLPHSHHIKVLAYRTGFEIGSFIPYMNDEEAERYDEEFAIESVCLAKYSRKLGEQTARDVLGIAEDDDSSHEERMDEEPLEQILEEVIVFAGCRDGSIREFSLKALLGTADLTSARCGTFHIHGPCFRPRRSIQLTKDDPIMHLAAPHLQPGSQEDGILIYLLARTKDLEESKDAKVATTQDNMNVKLLRILLPHFNETSMVSLVRKEEGDIQRKWQFENFRCRVGRDKSGRFINSTPFRLQVVTKPSPQDSTIFIIAAQSSSVHVYYDHAIHRKIYKPTRFLMPTENPITSMHVSPNNKDIACGHFFGEISIMNDALVDVEKYHKSAAKAANQFVTSNVIQTDDPRTKQVITKAHWHSHSVGSLCFDPMSSSVNPILYSGGSESVLVSWQIGQGYTKPVHYLPRVALGSIIHISCGDRLDDQPSNGILVYSDDNSLQLFLSHSKGAVWKIQGIACDIRHDIENPGRKPAIEMDPSAKGSLDAPLVMTGLPQAPGLMHWYDTAKGTLRAFLEIAPFNKVSKTEAEDDPMPVPCITNHAFGDNGNVLISIDETPTENVFVGAYDNKGGKESYGVVTTIRFWSRNGSLTSSHEATTSRNPYVLSASMSFPHGPKNLVSALSISRDGMTACTVSNDEKAFRMWKKTLDEDAEDTRRIPTWTCSYKVTIPAGFSNFPTVRNGVAFSDDGSTLALCAGNMVTLWDCNEARFLTSLRHLEGAIGLIDSVQFISSGVLKDLLLIKSNLGVSLQSPFGHRGGFKGWSWGIPWGTKSSIVSSTAYVESEGCVAITVFSSKTGRSRLVLVDALTGKPSIVSMDVADESHPVINGHIVSMSAAGRMKQSLRWDVQASNEEVDLRLFALTDRGELIQFRTEGSQGMTSELVKQLGKSEGPSLKISVGTSDKRKRDTTRPISVAELEPVAKKSALEVFGHVSTAEANAAPSTSELPSLSKNFVRSFVRRRLLHSAIEHKQQ